MDPNTNSDKYQTSSDHKPPDFSNHGSGNSLNYRVSSKQNSNDNVSGHALPRQLSDAIDTVAEVDKRLSATGSYNGVRTSISTPQIRSKDAPMHSLTHRFIKSPSGNIPRTTSTYDTSRPVEEQLSRKGLDEEVLSQHVVVFELQDYDPDKQDLCTRIIAKIQNVVHGFFINYKSVLYRIILVLLLIGYVIYFCYAIYYSLSGAVVVISLTGIVIFYLLIRLIWKHFGKQINTAVCKPIARGFEQNWWKYCKWCIYLSLVIAILTFLVLDVGSDLKRLTSCCGMVLIILFAFLTSTNPSRVNWRPVLWGIGLQFVLGIIILRWKSGYDFFRFLGDQVTIFLEYTDEGSRFVFGEQYMMHEMAFKVFPIVIYFGAVTSILYYWGLMQVIVVRIAEVMQFTMGTTAIESLNAAANIFIGMAESCVIMRPFVHKLTKSELHAVMTGGFATVAGSYIALLVTVGASPEHLLSAAIMSAPAALAMAKLSYPETEISHTKTKSDVYMEKTPARNVVEAASNGAMAAVKVVASVAANLIAILGLIAFINATLSYFGGCVGYPQFNFQLICYYLFWPLAAIMGVEIEDAGTVASLLGTKVFVDEFISFRDLGIIVKQGKIMERSKVIATYACCGFGSISAVGIYIGALVSVAPVRRGDISEVALRAMMNGNLASFLTACIAGMLYTGEQNFSAFVHDTDDAVDIFNSTMSMVTGN